MFEKHKDGKGSQAKLKTPSQLQELLDVTKELQQQLWSRKTQTATESGKAMEDEVGDGVSAGGGAWTEPSLIA